MAESGGGVLGDGAASLLLTNHTNQRVCGGAVSSSGGVQPLKGFLSF